MEYDSEIERIKQRKLFDLMRKGLLDSKEKERISDQPKQPPTIQPGRTCLRCGRDSDVHRRILRQESVRK